MKPNHIRRVLAIVIMLLAAILACNAPQTSPTSDLAVVVAQTQTAVAVSQLAAPTTPFPQALTPAVTQSSAAGDGIDT